MKPLPTEERPQESAKQIPSLPLNPAPGSFSTANRRSANCAVQRIYPWLLFASTAVAATFCLAYITKPVFLADPTPGEAVSGLREVASNAGGAPAVKERIEPDPSSLPGESGANISPSTPSDSPPAASLASAFEETNIRVQHILDAESPSGDISRIIVDVPVLYRSRNLRWTQAEAAQARDLLARLNEHQEKTRALRDEGRALLDDWNRLMDGSIPASSLRADSPSLPSNQFDPLAPTGPAVSDTVESIQLSEPDK